MDELLKKLNDIDLDEVKDELLFRVESLQAELATLDTEKAKDLALEQAENIREKAEELYKYVASKNNQYYFNFYLDGVYGIVLDIGEDHDDDYWEYYGTANYDEYRQKQIDFLQKEIESKEYEKYEYRCSVCSRT